MKWAMAGVLAAIAAAGCMRTVYVYEGADGTRYYSDSSDTQFDVTELHPSATDALTYEGKWQGPPLDRVVATRTLHVRMASQPLVSHWSRMFRGKEIEVGPQGQVIVR